ncbi:hypothetical protein JXA70_18885, partial [candidate division KSB1 bacterium]|nr:hypothetical protein [candidate division KSB1 bacterium]
LWSEVHQNVQVKDGYFSAILGSIKQIDVSVFEKKERYLEIKIGDETLSPRQKIASSSYAYAAAAIQGKDNVFPSSGNVGIGVANPDNKLKVAGVVESTTGGFKFPDGSVMTKAANGGGSSWNHTATQNINLNGHWLSGDGDNEGIFINSLGNMGIGVQDAGGAKIKSIQTGATDKAGFFQIINEENDSQALLANTNGKGLALYASNYGTGRAAFIGINNPENPSYALEVATNGTGSAIKGEAESTSGVTFGGYFSSRTTLGAGVYGVSSGGMARGIMGTSSGVAGQGVYGLAEGRNGYGGYFESRQGTGIYAKGSDGKPAAEFKGNIQIQSQSTGETVIELGEGLDYAEGFNTTPGELIMPGDVVIIDPKTPGKLKKSSDPYDNKVAGIVAGANGLGSGIRLGPDQFDLDVALAGRVYCNVDASFGEIKAGDLLTTSPTPGHAMAVNQYENARGAILGKAMESLQVGETGKILVLVTLQ